MKVYIALGICEERRNVLKEEIQSMYNSLKIREGRDNVAPSQIILAIHEQTTWSDIEKIFAMYLIMTSIYKETL